MDTPAADDNLLQRAMTGDTDALSDLLDQHAGQLRESLTGAIQHRWRALFSLDDLLQETFVDAFLGIDKFQPRGDGAFAAWLHTLARRNLLDAIKMLEAEKRGGHRKVTRATNASFDVLLQTLTGSATTPSGQVARGEAREALHLAIEALPPEYQTVIRMYDLAGDSMDAVAASLGRTPGAAYLLRLRAHRRLRELLGEPSHFLSGSA